MNPSKLGTASPTSFMIVLYCASSREHAGAYLREPETGRESALTERMGCEGLAGLGGVGRAED
jgi:hypothetical protein